MKKQSLKYKKFNKLKLKCNLSKKFRLSFKFGGHKPRGLTPKIASCGII
jgi:hypothetical protein